MTAAIRPEMPVLSRWQSAGTMILALAAFHLAYFFEAAGGMIILYLAAMYYLPRLPTRRWAFYLGFLLGYAIGVPHLFFLFGIFGWGAIGLWGVFALWFAFYLLLGRLILDRWPSRGHWLLPCLWLAIEFFRSELYPLRFSWLIPGFALSDPLWIDLVGTVGVYGFSFFIMLAIAAFDRLPRRFGLPWAVVCLSFISFIVLHTSGPTGRCLGVVNVAGMQMESPTEIQVLSGLDKMLGEHPDAELLLLPEYTFEGPVPESVREWCREHKKYLVAGGREEAQGSEDFYNTIFVVSPEGEIVFTQVKAQPIPFFEDGLPAERQGIWESPWGRLGVAVCYDMSYSRVMDPLVNAGAQALIIPAVDVITWGEWEHRLHAKIAIVRAREYQLPLFRLASSGISTFTDRQGAVSAEGTYPGHGEILAAPICLDTPGVLPLDRYFALPMTIAMGAIVLFLFVYPQRQQGPSHSPSPPIVTRSVSEELNES